MDEERRQEITRQGSNQMNLENGSLPINPEIKKEVTVRPQQPERQINTVMPEKPPVVQGQVNTMHRTPEQQPPVMQGQVNTVNRMSEPVTGAPRSQYPPNVGAGQTQYPMNTQGYYMQDVRQQPKKKKKKNVGLMIFLISLGAVVLLTITAIVGVFVGKKIVGTDENGTYHYEDRDEDYDNGENENVSPNNDGPELEIQDDGKEDDEDADDIVIEDGKVLTPAQIAKKADNISVGVLVYSKSTERLAGEGTGIVMSLDDKKEYTYIITCAHVVDDTNINIAIQTNKGETFEAEAVGVDSRTDIAVLRVKTNKLECAVFGNSDKLKVGDPVYAIGNPGGTEFFGSFTDGMVSAIDRPVSSEIGYAMKCIQHTAPINSGNSGGALLNSYGQVIGINSSKIMATGFEGMGFSIPITDAKVIVDKLIKYGRVADRAKLGITYYTASTSEKGNMLIKLENLPAGSLIIESIASDSDLANKDVKVGDIITAVDGKKLTEASVLLEKIENGKAGDEFTLTIVRFDSQYDSKTFDVKVKLVADDGSVTQKEEETQNFDYFNPFG